MTAKNTSSAIVVQINTKGRASLKFSGAHGLTASGEYERRTREHSRDRRENCPAERADDPERLGLRCRYLRLCARMVVRRSGRGGLGHIAHAASPLVGLIARNRSRRSSAA